MKTHSFLVGGLNMFEPSEKYEFVNWDDEIRNRWKKKKCSKPPTSNLYIVVLGENLSFTFFLELGVSPAGVPLQGVASAKKITKLSAGDPTFMVHV